MSTHTDTLAEARGERETPMERLQRQRDELLEALEEIAGSYYQREPYPADLMAEIATCGHCKGAALSALPGNHCAGRDTERHYERMSDHDRRQERNAAHFDATLRDIARAAIARAKGESR